MRGLPLLLCLLAACAPPRAPAILPPTSALAPAVELVDAVPGTICVRRDAEGVLEGEGVEALNSAVRWPKDCLPAAKVLPETELLKAAQVVLEAPAPGLRTATAVSRCLLLSPRGWQRRAARWVLAISFEQAGLSAMTYVDGATGAPLGALDARQSRHEQLLTVPTAQWGGDAHAEGYRPPNFELLETTSLSPSVPSGEFSVYGGACAATAGACHLEHTSVARYCEAAKMPRCLEPLERDFEARVRPLVAAHARWLTVLAVKPGEVRWLTSKQEVFAWLGHPLETVAEARMLLAVEGTLVGVAPESSLPRPGYLRFDDLKVPLEPGHCSGFVLESDGARTAICLPKVPCHPPTAAQRAQLAQPVPSEVCETGDGGFGFTYAVGGCPCNKIIRNGVQVAGSCAPCAQRGP